MKVLIDFSLGPTWFITDHIIFSPSKKVVFVSANRSYEYDFDRIIEVKDDEE